MAEGKWKKTWTSNMLNPSLRLWAASGGGGGAQREIVMPCRPKPHPHCGFIRVVAESMESRKSQGDADILTQCSCIMHPPLWCLPPSGDRCTSTAEIRGAQVRLQGLVVVTKRKEQMGPSTAD